MNRRLAGLFLGLFCLTLAACGGGGGYGGGGGSGMPGGSTATLPPSVGSNAVGLALPQDNIGTVNTAPWGTVGGYTQQVYSQVLAFAPGTVVTLKNLSSVPHTLNVLSTTAFPSNPTLSTNASGSSTLDANYASGTIAAGGTLNVTLANAGTYYIGCGYDYNNTVSMRDVLQVSSSATPGPQATPQSSGGGTGPGCTGYYC